MKNVLKWKNTYSGEEGFVEKTSSKNKCFYDTKVQDKAKVYANETSATNAIKQLETYGQGSAINNVFEIVPV